MWQMVMDQDVASIVMLCQITEKEKVKCYSNHETNGFRVNLTNPSVGSAKQCVYARNVFLACCCCT